MFFATTAPHLMRRQPRHPAGYAVDRFLADALQAPRHQVQGVAQDDTSYTLSFDVPGIAREQLSVGIEGGVVRIQTREDSPRKYRAAYELPTEIDVAGSTARLENGVLTLKLAKLVPVSKVTELAIS